MFELVGGHKALNGQMVLGRLQILPQSQHIDIVLPKIVHAGLNFIITLTQTQHQGGLGHHIGSISLPHRKHIQCLLVARTGVTYRMGQSLHRLDILRKDLNA